MLNLNWGWLNADAMPGPAEDATAAAAATEAGAAADAEPAHQDGLRSEIRVTSHVTTRSKRHGPNPAEEDSRVKRPKQELSEEDACAKPAQLRRKRQKAESAQNDADPANTAKAKNRSESTESAQPSNGANHTDPSIEHKLDAEAHSAAELNSDSDSGPELESQGETRHFSSCHVCGKLCAVLHS